MDLSFKNELIKKYFEGDDSYIPSSELVYLHTHPLIKGSFLVEIERMVNESTEIIISKNIQGIIIARFIEATQKFGAELPTISQENAPRILHQLRIVYGLCKKLLR